MNENRLKHLSDRLDYFEGKEIKELEDDEIIEFLAIRQELRKTKESIIQAWENVKETVNKWMGDV